jgi:hypothetical protein
MINMVIEIVKRSVQIIPNSVSKVNTFEVVNYASNVIALHKKMVYILQKYIL